MTDDERLVIAREIQRHELDRARRDGALERVRHGAYRYPEPQRVEHVAVTTRRRMLAHARAVHRQLTADHVFSHETAALLHGLRLWRPPATTHVIQGYRRSSAAAPDIRRHQTLLPPEHRAEASDLPATSPARTVVDCALSMHPLEGLVIADHALAGGLDLEECRAILGTVRRRNGTARARWVLSNADGGADSAWETWLRYVTLRAGFPRPMPQAPISTGLGTFHCDLGWPEWAVYAEFDGLAKYQDGGVRAGHDARQELLREKSRFDAIRATGVNPVRVTATGNAGLAKIVDTLAARFPVDVRRTLRINPLLSPPPGFPRTRASVRQ